MLAFKHVSLLKIWVSVHLVAERVYHLPKTCANIVSETESRINGTGIFPDEFTMNMHYMLGKYTIH